MALRRVNLSSDVYFVCLNHAMCTEGEEIVGLLVGEVDLDRVAHVSAVLVLRRSDKRKDRVEISPEQLSNASTEAEKLACLLKRPVRVIGWYHSHPKLTVYPSIVDVCTQESYQLMDEGFIGMIFSVFNSDPNKLGGRIQMICYQSQTVIIDCNVEKSHVEIPIQLVPSANISDVCMNTVIQLPRFLCQEEQLAYQMANQVPLDYLTRLYNSSVYLRKMGQIAEVICGPLLKMLEERIFNNEMKRKLLQDRKKALMENIRALKSKQEERALLKRDMEENIKKKQQELEELEEKQLREALLKDQELRAKQKALQNQEETMVDNQNVDNEIKSSVEQEIQIDLQCNKEKTDNGDQEVPQFKEQNKSTVSGLGMQEVISKENKSVHESQIKVQELYKTPLQTPAYKEDTRRNKVPDNQKFKSKYKKSQMHVKSVLSKEITEFEMTSVEDEVVGQEQKIITLSEEKIRQKEIKIKENNLAIQAEINIISQTRDHASLSSTTNVSPKK